MRALSTQGIGHCSRTQRPLHLRPVPPRQGARFDDLLACHEQPGLSGCMYMCVCVGVGGASK